jgi:hypothetical protein
MKTSILIAQYLKRRITVELQEQGIKASILLTKYSNWSVGQLLTAHLQEQGK